MRAIAFVCSANLCRSAMAHAICAAEVGQRMIGVTVYSAGTMDLTGIDVALEAVRTCLSNRTPVMKRSATFLADIPLSQIDHFLVMERKHEATLVREYGIDVSKITLLGTLDPEGGSAEIEDPINQDAAAFDACYQRMRRCIRNYFATNADFRSSS